MAQLLDHLLSSELVLLRTASCTLATYCTADSDRETYMPWAWVVASPRRSLITSWSGRVNPGSSNVAGSILARIM